MIGRKQVRSAALAALIAVLPLAVHAAPGAEAVVETRLAAAKAAMMGDPHAALTLSTQALALARAETVSPQAAGRRDQAIAKAQWLQGEALLRLDRASEAAPVIAAGLAVAVAKAPDTQLHGDLLMSQAAVEAMRGQVQLALRDYQTAYRIFIKAGQPRGQAVALQNIGSIYQDAHDYQKVLYYYAQSAEAYPADPLLRLSAANNIGNALMSGEQYDRAVVEFARARQIAQQMGSPQLEARIAANLAVAEAHRGHLDAAQAQIEAAGALLRDRPNAEEAERSVMKASVQVELARGRPKVAAQLLSRLFQGVDLKTTGPAYIDVHEAAYRTYLQLGDTRLALAHLEAFKRLDDQGQALAASTNAALMGAQFDYANQASRIAQLKAGQLQRDVKLARSRNVVTTVLLATSLMVAAVLLAAVLGVRRSRNLARAANRRLSQANKLLEKALKARTEFLANTSHEMRTPLNGVLGMTEVVLAEPDLDPTLRERVQVIGAGARTMRALVDDILDMARIETDGVTLHRAAFDLPVLARDAAQLWRDEAAAKGLALTCELQDSPGRIVEDADRLRQILFVLLSNAVKFTATGAVGLSLSAIQALDGERLILRVADTGVGIPPEKLTEVFEPFRQVDSSRTRAHGGAGLGLAICRRLVQAMGGEIRLDSAVGRGTIVTVALPLTRDALAMPVTAAAPSLQDRALLLCDANPLTRSVVSAVLRPKVRRLEAVGSRQAALEAAFEGGFDLLLIEASALGDTSDARRTRLSELRDALGSVSVVVLLPEGAADDEVQTAGVTVLRKPITAAALVDALSRLAGDAARGAPEAHAQDAKAIATA